MSPISPVPARRPCFMQRHCLDDRVLAREASASLLAPAAAVAPKFFYDPLGSRLFDAITLLDEYDLTRKEAAIFARHGSAIVDAALLLTGPAPTLIDLGAGSCAKAARLFGALRPRRYIAVDISVDFVREALEGLQRAHPDLELLGLGLDFSSALALPPALVDGPALVFYPGSSVGNFDPQQALRLLREARAAAAGGALLIGVDLLRDAALLQAAYDDELGLTAAFNLNLLRHLNRLLGADFAPRQWQHCARFEPRQARVEMHLQARSALTVRWHLDGQDCERRFAAGECIHTENAYKWTTASFAALLREAGCSASQHWCDPDGSFAVFLAR